MKVQDAITTTLLISSLCTTLAVARDYNYVIQETASMVSNSTAQALARKAYEQAQQAQQAQEEQSNDPESNTEAKDDNVVDAEFEEVD